MNERNFPEFDTTFSFVRRPSSLPPDLRPMWKISMLVLMLHICCRSGRSSLQRLHVLNWAVRNRESREDFTHLIEGRIDPTDVAVRFEPALQRAIDLAIGGRLIDRLGGDKIQLTNIGRKFAISLMADGCVAIEKEFFQAVRRNVTESRIEQLVNGVGR